MELFLKYQEIDLYDYGLSTGMNPPEHIIKDAEKAKLLYDWARNYKTMICLNGGANKELWEILTLFHSNENNYPWSIFEESNEALGGIVTNIAIILPQRIFENASKIKKREFFLKDQLLIDNNDKEIDIFSKFEIDLINLLNISSLAK